jgi:pyruvate kinase
LSYGIWAVFQEEKDNTKEYFLDALNQLIRNGLVKRSDMAAYLSSSFGEGGGTSFLEINNVGKILEASCKFNLPVFK